MGLSVMMVAFKFGRHKFAHVDVAHAEVVPKGHLKAPNDGSWDEPHDVFWQALAVEAQGLAGGCVFAGAQMVGAMDFSAPHLFSTCKRIAPRDEVIGVVQMFVKIGECFG